MRTVLVLLTLLVVVVPLTLPAGSAAPPSVERCWWIINGPTLFNRVCVDSTDRDCPVYQETWTWEGGYNKRCLV